MVDHAEITPLQVETILAIEENHFYDVKAIEIKPGKLTELKYRLSPTAPAARFISA